MTLNNNEFELIISKLDSIESSQSELFKMVHEDRENFARVIGTIDVSGLNTRLAKLEQIEESRRLAVPLLFAAWTIVQGAFEWVVSTLTNARHS